MNIPERNSGELKIMLAVDIETVASFAWSEELGTKLRSLRDSRGLTRGQLSLLTNATGRPVSEQYIQQIESPRLFAGKGKKSSRPTVSKEILVALCQAMGTDVTSLLASSKIFWNVS